MRTSLLASAFGLLTSLLPANAADACARLHLQGLHFGAGREATARLSCIVEEGLLPAMPVAAEYSLFADDLPPTQGQRVAISSEPLNLVIVVQVSPTMESALPDIKVALNHVADALTSIPGSTVALVTYATEVQTVIGLGHPERLGRAVEKIAAVPDSTEASLLPAIDVGYGLLKNRPPEARRVLLLISDGLNSEMTPKKALRAFKEVGARVHAAGVVVAPVGYAPFEPEQLRYLKALTQATDGQWHLAEETGRIDAEIQALLEELKQQQLVTFPLPQDVKAGRVRFQVMDPNGRSSEPLYGNVPSEALTIPKIETQPERRVERWRDWASLAGVFLGISLVGLTFLRRPARVGTIPPSLPPPTDPLPALGKTVLIHRAQRIMVAWVVRLGANGRHETIEVGDILTLGEGPQRCQICRLADGYESAYLDNEGARQRIEDGRKFRVGNEMYKFKCVMREG